MKGIKILLGVMVLSLLVAALWDKLPIIKGSVNFVLLPTLGALLSWSLLWGMIIIVFVINVIFVIIHKFGTNQEELKSLKEEQKKFREQMKQAKDQPEKMMELQKKQMENLPATFSKNLELTMKPLMYTAIPLILSLRWFSDFFIAMESPKIFLGLGWLGTYIIFSLIFSMTLRKILRVH